MLFSLLGWFSSFPWLSPACEEGCAPCHGLRGFPVDVFEVRVGCALPCAPSRPAMVVCLLQWWDSLRLGSVTVPSRSPAGPSAWSVCCWHEFVVSKGCVRPCPSAVCPVLLSQVHTCYSADMDWLNGKRSPQTLLTLSRLSVGVTIIYLLQFFIVSVSMLHIFCILLESFNFDSKACLILSSTFSLCTV